MHTLKSLREKKTVKVKRVYHGKYAVEDIDKMREDILSHYPSDKFKLTESEGFFSVGPIDAVNVSQIRSILKPKINREVIGFVTFRSKDYVFEYDGGKSYGELKASDLTETGWQIPTFDGSKLEYIIL